jgi:hypothetical protein
VGLGVGVECAECGVLGWVRMRVTRFSLILPLDVEGEMLLEFEVAIAVAVANDVEIELL